MCHPSWGQALAEAQRRRQQGVSPHPPKAGERRDDQVEEGQDEHAGRGEAPLPQTCAAPAPASV